MPKGVRIFDGAKFRKARRDVGLTQEDFSDIGIQQSQISKYENGWQEPTPDTAKALAIKVKVSLDYLFSLIDNPNESLSESTMEDDFRILNEIIERRGIERVKEEIDKRSS